jgi:hypothetical protein
VLESRALAEDTPPVPPDQTLPDLKRIAAASDVLRAFVDATFVEGLDAKPKRKAESHAQAVDVAEVSTSRSRDLRMTFMQHTPRPCLH